MGLVTPSYFAGMPIKIEEPNISNKHITWEKNPIGERQTIWLFTSMAEDLN